MKEHRLFKKLTPANWLERDKTSEVVVRVKADGKTEQISPNQWAGYVLEHELNESVPEDVRNLFEVAQGVLCYGCFFYPLYALGSEHVYRVLEAALRCKADELGAPRSKKRFIDKLDWLNKRGVFSESRYRQWDASRRLRNAASHVERQSIYDPTMAVRTIAVSVELINELFQVEIESEAH